MRDLFPSFDSGGPTDFENCSKSTLFSPLSGGLISGGITHVKYLLIVLKSDGVLFLHGVNGGFKILSSNLENF